MTENQSGILNAQKRQRLLKNIWRDRYLFLLTLPLIAYYVIFHFVPLSGLVIAFKKFTPGKGIYAGKWVGLRWFTEFFNSPFAWRTIRNTLLLSFYSIVIGFPAPIIFAICVTELRTNKARRVVQTVSYLPHFISTVVLVGMVQNMFTTNTGIVNNIIAAFGGKRITFLMAPEWFRTLYVGSGVWQSFGYNSIIYIAAIVGIDPTLYEAGSIDGITKFQQVRYITLPMIAQTIVLLFIMRLGSMMSIGFEKVYLMYSPAVYETADVISTYVYRKGIEGNNFGYATAIGLFNSVINFSLVVLANTVSRKLTDSGMW